MLGLAGAGVLTGWFSMGAGPDRGGSATVAIGLWLLAAGSALHFWRCQTTGTIRWDGQSWAVADRREPDADFIALSTTPQVLMDLQSHLWVHVAPTGRRGLWLWLERSSQPERWWDLRRAVYSRAKPGVEHADASAPASSRGA